MATFASSWCDVQDRHTKLSIVIIVFVIAVVVVVVIFLVCVYRCVGKGKVVAHRRIRVILRRVEQFAEFFLDK